MKEKAEATRPSRTIKSLGLDLKSAREGKTWLLLPAGFRDRDSGTTYPLPTQGRDILKLSLLVVAPNKQDCGCFYIRRARKQLIVIQSRKQSTAVEIARRSFQVENAKNHFQTELKEQRAEARAAVQEVQAAAAEAIANLGDLFSLGRKGLDGMMKAHLEGGEWQGEKISSHAFRECFRMVTQAVKGLGMPTGQRDKAREAILEEAAAAVEATQDALSLSAGSTGANSDPPTEH